MSKFYEFCNQRIRVLEKFYYYWIECNVGSFTTINIFPLCYQCARGFNICVYLSYSEARLRSSWAYKHVSQLLWPSLQPIESCGSVSSLNSSLVGKADFVGYSVRLCQFCQTLSISQSNLIYTLYSFS